MAAKAAYSGCPTSPPQRPDRTVDLPSRCAGDRKRARNASSRDARVAAAKHIVTGATEQVVPDRPREGRRSTHRFGRGAACPDVGILSGTPCCRAPSRQALAPAPHQRHGPGLRTRPRMHSPGPSDQGAGATQSRRPATGSANHQLSRAGASEADCRPVPAHWTARWPRRRGSGGPRPDAAGSRPALAIGWP